MDRLAVLACNVACSNCMGLITDVVTFQWGGLPAAYRPGERIRWWRHSDGTVEEPFRPLWHMPEYFNYGNPEYENVWVLDHDFTDAPSLRQCPTCGIGVAGIKIDIEGGAIDWAWPLKPNAFELEGRTAERVAVLDVTREGPTKHTRFLRWYDPRQGG
jgi:hypothetical protein